MFADRGWIIGAVNAVFGVAEIQRACTQWIAGATADPTGQIRLTRHHLRRWNPVGPFGLAYDGLNSGPSETLAADADSITHGHAMAHGQIKERMRGIDDDRARRFTARIGDHLAAQLRRQLLRGTFVILRLRRILRRVLRQWLVETKYRREGKRLRESGTSGHGDNRERHEHAATAGSADC